MGRWRDAERINNRSGKRLFLYSDINCKIRWAYSSRNYVNNFTLYWEIIDSYYFVTLYSSEVTHFYVNKQVWKLERDV